MLNTGDRVQIQVDDIRLRGTVVKIRKTVQVMWDEYGYATWEKSTDLERIEQRKPDHRTRAKRHKTILED
jgi:hypothetical protein